MTIEETRALWEKFKAAYQAHDAEALSGLSAEDVVLVGTPLRGRAALKRLDASWFAAFPDYRREYLTEVVGDDTVVAVHHSTATHTGRFMGVEATGMRLDISGCLVLKVRDGLFAEVQVFQRDVTGQLRREANLQLVRRLYEADNAHDASACRACLAPDVEVWGNGSLIRSGREAQVRHLRENFAAFPDWHVETLSLLADGDVVVARWRGSGTHSAPYGGIPATGKRIEIFGTSSFEIRDGLIQFYRFDLDTSPLLMLTGG